MKPRVIKILIVEDQADVSDFLAEILKLNGFDVVSADSFRSTMFAIENEPFDLVLLDLKLPDGNGFDLIKILKERRDGVPVIVQTGFGRDENCVTALKLGADDFVEKPIRQGVLLARIEAVLRRVLSLSVSFEEMPLRVGAVAFYSTREIVFCDGQRVRLTFREASLLRVLFSKKGEAVSVEELLFRVWNANPAGLDGARIASLVSRLRKKLSDVATIRPVARSGYVLVV